jgi:hypothetical protein
MTSGYPCPYCGTWPQKVEEALELARRLVAYEDDRLLGFERELASALLAVHARLEQLEEEKEMALKSEPVAGSNLRVFSYRVGPPPV